MSRARITLSAEAAGLATRLGHEFTHPELLLQALTHPSIATPGRPDNQRLEFLGDRVLGLVIADALLAADTGAREGQLAPRLNALVRKETCAEVARRIDLGAALRLGRSEMLSGGRRKEALLGDAMEAVIAAVYLDAGYTAARAVVLAHWQGLLASVETDARDPKSTLQELTQARGEPPPSYIEIAREGPPHAPRFTVEVRLADGQSARATAPSKRAAEMATARLLLDRFESQK